MRKKHLHIFILFLIANFSCERDDLCPETTQTTPKLIIDLYDIAEPEELKNVFDIRIKGIDNDEALPGYNVATAANKLILPLNTKENSTSYRLHIDYSVNDNGTPDNPDDDFLEGNEDIITISYAREDVYVSRACGYKTIFRNVSLSVDTANDNDRWIINIESLLENQSIENETTTHFNIFH